MTLRSWTLMMMIALRKKNAVAGQLTELTDTEAAVVAVAVVVWRSHYCSQISRVSGPVF